MNVALPYDVQVVRFELEVVQVEFVNVPQQMFRQERGQLLHLVGFDLTVSHHRVLDAHPPGQQEDQKVQQFNRRAYQPVVHQVDEIPYHLALRMRDLEHDFLVERVVLGHFGLLLLQLLLVLIQLDEVVLDGDQPDVHQFEAQEEELGDGAELPLDLHLLQLLLLLVYRLVFTLQGPLFEHVVLGVDAFVFLSLLAQEGLAEAQHHHVRIQD